MGPMTTGAGLKARKGTTRGQFFQFLTAGRTCAIRARGNSAGVGNFVAAEEENSGNFGILENFQTENLEKIFREKRENLNESLGWIIIFMIFGRN